MSPHVATRLAIPFVFLIALATCQDDGDPLGPDDGERPIASRQVLSCEANVAALTLSCAPPTVTASEGLSLLIVGGQRDYVTLASRNVSYAAGVFQADVRVQSRISQPLGTPDGTTITGIRPFFHTQPAATSGDGTITVANEAGTATFTAADQPYFEYSEILTRYGVSAEQTWQWNSPRR